MYRTAAHQSRVSSRYISKEQKKRRQTEKKSSRSASEKKSSSPKGPGTKTPKGRKARQNRTRKSVPEKAKKYVDREKKKLEKDGPQPAKETRLQNVRKVKEKLTCEHRNDTLSPLNSSNLSLDTPPPTDPGSGPLSPRTTSPTTYRRRPTYPSAFPPAFHHHRHLLLRPPSSRKLPSIRSHPRPAAASNTPVHSAATP